MQLKPELQRADCEMVHSDKDLLVLIS